MDMEQERPTLPFVPSGGTRKVGRADREAAMAGRVEAAARALVGTPFRLHGRSEHGLDCVGLVALAAWRAGHAGVAPAGYRLRGGEPERFAAWLKAAGLRRVRTARAGDVLLVRAGPAQFHLMLKTGAGFVHAHAGIGRVVEMPGVLPWPLISAWRFSGD